VFWASWDSSRAFTANFLLQLLVRRAGVHILGLRRLGDNAAVRVRAGFDELAFTLVPGSEDLGARCAAEDTRVDEACETDTGDVATGAEDAFEVPDGFCARSRVSDCN
jgi:hypothetical protein